MRKRLSIAFLTVCLAAGAATAESDPACEKAAAQMAEIKGAGYPAVDAVRQALGTADFANKQGISLSDPKALSASEAMNRYLISQYVTARESFASSEGSNSDGVRVNYAGYNLVRVLSSPQVFSGYQHQIILSNPQSPGTRLGAKGMRMVQIGNIAFAGNTGLPYDEDARTYKVQVHIDEKGDHGIKSLDKTITIVSKYTQLELSKADHCLNPAMFRVIGYDNSN